MVPGGMPRMAGCAMAVICAMPAENVGVGLKENLDHGNAVIGLRLDMLDVVDGGGGITLNHVGETVLHVLRGKPGVIEDNADDGNIDIRKNVDRRLEDGDPGEDDNQ